MTTRNPYPSDVYDDEWAFVAPYLTLVTEDAPHRDHSLREVFNALRWLVRAGASWWRCLMTCRRCIQCIRKPGVVLPPDASRRLSTTCGNSSAMPQTAKNSCVL
jgi:transposase